MVVYTLHVVIVVASSGRLPTESILCAPIPDDNSYGVYAAGHQAPTQSCGSLTMYPHRKCFQEVGGYPMKPRRSPRAGALRNLAGEASGRAGARNILHLLHFPSSSRVGRLVSKTNPPT